MGSRSYIEQAMNGLNNKEEEAMKKTSKLFGTMALSAALALGCAMPAFAAEPYGTSVDETTGPENVKQGSNVSTDVHVATRITNINVAVPLNVTIVADAASNEVLAPTSGLKHYTDGAFDASATTGYRIENYSPFPVKITDIATQDTSDGAWVLTADDVIGEEAKAGKIGDLNLTIKPSGFSQSDTEKNEGNKHPEADTKNGINLASIKVEGDATKSGTDPKWIIDRKVTTDEPSIMGLTLSGSNSILKNVNEGSILMGTDKDPVTDGPDPVEADKAFKIFYTVSATSLAS